MSLVEVLELVWTSNYMTVACLHRLRRVNRSVREQVGHVLQLCNVPLHNNSLLEEGSRICVECGVSRFIFVNTMSMKIHVCLDCIMDDKGYRALLTQKNILESAIPCKHSGAPWSTKRKRILYQMKKACVLQKYGNMFWKWRWERPFRGQFKTFHPI